MPAKAENRDVFIKNNALTNDTINLMVFLVNNYSWQVKDLAKKLKGSNNFETGKNIWNWVKTNIEYEIDGKSKKILTEQVRTPARTISDKKGDCDCMSVLVASLLKENNIKPFFKVVGYKDEKNFLGIPICNGFSHVYTFFNYNNGIIYIDTVPEIPIYNYEYNANEICKQKIINIMRLEALFGTVTTSIDPNIILQEKIFDRLVLNGEKKINSNDFSKKFSILVIDNFEKELKNKKNYFEQPEENLKFIDKLKKIKTEEEYLEMLKNAPLNKEFYLEVAENFEKGLKINGIDIIEDEEDRRTKRNEIDLANIGKVTKIKKTLLTPIREAFKIILAVNFNHIAEKLAVGMTNEEKAKKIGISKEDYLKIQKAKNDFVKKFIEFGGTEEELKKAIIKSKKAKEILNGIEDFEQEFNGIEDFEQEFNGFEDFEQEFNGFEDFEEFNCFVDESENLGIVAETGITAAIATATPLMIAFGNIFKNTDNLFRKKTQQETNIKKDIVNISKPEITTTTKIKPIDKIKNVISDFTNILIPKSQQKTESEQKTNVVKTEETKNKNLWIVVFVIIIIGAGIYVFYSYNKKIVKGKKKRLNGIKRKRTTKKILIKRQKNRKNKTKTKGNRTTTNKKANIKKIKK